MNLQKDHYNDHKHMLVSKRRVETASAEDTSPSIKKQKYCIGNASWKMQCALLPTLGVRGGTGALSADASLQSRQGWGKKMRDG